MGLVREDDGLGVALRERLEAGGDIHGVADDGVFDAAGLLLLHLELLLGDLRQGRSHLLEQTERAAELLVGTDGDLARALEQRVDVAIVVVRGVHELVEAGDTELLQRLSGHGRSAQGEATAEERARSTWRIAIGRLG